LAVTLAVVGAALVWAAPSSQGAASPTGTSVTMVSEGEYIGGGVAREWDSRSGSVTISGGGTEIDISVSGGTSASAFTMTFAAPPGQSLGVGSYEGAQRTPFRQAGRPGIDIYGEGRGCNTVTGRFDILDMAAAGAATSRLWLVYEHHCEGGPRSLFGEVRINEPLNSAGLLVAPRVIRWPSAEAGATGAAVPVTIRNTAANAVSVGTVTVGGSKPADFPIRADECSSVTLQSGDACQIFVTSTPKTAGSSTATLRIPDDVDSTAPTVKLDAYVIPGVTSWSMDSDTGDYIGGGASYSWTPATAQIAITGGRSGIHASLSGSSASGTSSWWNADFVPASGDIITTGPYTGATRYPFNGSGPGLSVTGDGRGCNTLTGQFTIRQAVFSQADGTLSQLAVDFEQHCEGATPALRGTLQLHATDGTTEVVPPRPSLVPTTTTTTTTAAPPTTSTTVPRTTITTTGAQPATTTTTVKTQTPTTAPPTSDPETHTAVSGGETDGYRMVDAGGHIYGFGDAESLGNAAVAAGARTVDLETSPVGDGYWVLDSDGTVHAFGDARRLGSLAPGALTAGETATSLSATRTGGGYWIFTSRGRAITFGDATFYGDMAGHRLNAPVLDSIPTTSGQGYFMVAADGGIFSFGDSMGGVRLNAPVRSLVPDPDGAGYWLVAVDGGIFAFDAPFRGSMGGRPLNRAVTGMVPFGDGYLMVAEDGGVFNFSNRQFLGSLGGHPPAEPVVSIAAR
jgi:hypothetical protein